MTPDVFLSYNREDQATAKRFAEAFESEGYSVWWDMTLRSGEAYDQVTEEALRSAKAVVVLWSKKSVVSRWVRAEATLADRYRTFVPARIEACDLPIMFELTQTADLSHWAGETSDPVWRAFIDDVRRLTKAKAAPVMAAARPADKQLQREVRPSIAVLPFINRSGKSEDDVFADGMVEDLTVALSVSRQMKVIAASATAVYRTGARDLRQIGRALGARYLLEGNVRRVDNNLRVTAQLVEAEDGDILWTQKFDRPLSELAVLQEELVTEVAAHLGVQVQRAEMEHALRKPEDITAWEALLRADVFLLRFTLSGIQAGITECKRAVEIDSNYGLAYAFLAAFQASLFTYSYDYPGLADEILENIRRAHALDPGNPLVLIRIAGAYTGLQKPQEALPFAERAAAINPNIEFVRFVFGAVLSQLGQSEKALAELDAAERLGPDSPLLPYLLCWQSVAHGQAGRFGLARDAADRAVRLFPAPMSLSLSVLCLAKSNDWEHARKALHRLREMDPGISRATVEGLVRFSYCGANAVDDYAAIVRKVWDEAESSA